MFAKRTQKIVQSEIRRIFSTADKNENTANLSIGQPDFDVPDKIKETAINSIKKGFNQYAPTEGLFELRQKIAKKLRDKNQIDAESEQILVTSGVSGGIFLAFLALVENGDEIIILDPYFLLYKHLTHLFGGVPVFIDTYPHFQPDLKQISRSISSKTKLIIINTPNNPTGTVYSEKMLTEIAEIAQKHNLLILSDEIYEDFIYEGKHFSIGSIYDKTLTLNGFSKSCAMTGWRIGYACGPRHIIEEMIKLQQFSFVCAPSFAQKSAVKALEFDNSCFVHQYQKNRDLLCKGLEKHLRFQKPSGSFYLFPESPNRDSARFVKRLANMGIVTVSGNVFSEKNTHFRISYAVPEKTLLRVIETIRSMK